MSIQPNATSTRQLISIGMALTVTSLSASGQVGTWTKQAPLPSAGSIMSVAALSATQYWCSAAPYPFSNNGQVAHTTNGGTSWDVTTLDLGGVSAVFFLDAMHGWTAGGAFRHTTDGGQTWITDNNWGSIADLFFLDTQRGWACGNGGVAYSTTDGGVTWSSVVTPAGGNLSSIWFQDALNGWAVPIMGRIIRTTDGGLSWSEVFDPGAYLSTVQFVSALEGWAIGGDTFLHTVDGGVTWNAASVPAGTWSHGARFFDPLNGVAVGDGGQIVRTTDGGQTWSTVRPQGSGPGLVDVEYGSAQTIVCSGSGGALVRSTDGGATWSSIQSGAWGITASIEIHDAHLAWATNQGGEIVRTTNGGQRWERVAVTGYNSYGDLRDIDFVDANTGWVVGGVSTLSSADARVARSDDGGLSWTEQLYVPGSQFYGVSALSAQRAIVFGGGNSSPNGYTETFDGGLTWVPGGPPAIHGLRDAHFLDDALTGWIVGADIWHTTDGGATWSLQYQSPGPMLASVSFSDANHGWVVGFGTQVLRTSDGGQTWIQQSVGAPSGTGIMGVTAVDSMTAWIAGWNGFVARTTDGGASWQQEPLAGADDAFFECAEFLNEETGWVAGNYGIYRRDAFTDCQDATSYCVSIPNSTGLPATIGFSGSCSASGGNLTLEASPVPDQPFLFYFGPDQTQVVFGNGFRCVGGFLTRLYPPLPASGGIATRLLNPAALGFGLGDSTNFQCWYRDPIGGGAGYNLSDGLHVVFE